MNHPLPSLPLVIIDLETTGLHPARSGIVQIGAVDLRAESRREFSTDLRVFAEARIEAEALAVNGLTLDQCRDPQRPSEDDALLALLEWLGPADFVLAGMNPRFDRDFLVCAARRSSSRLDRTIWIPATHRTVDLHSLSMHYALRIGHPIPDRGFHTNACLELAGLAPEPEPHVAVVGARLIAQAISFFLSQ